MKIKSIKIVKIKLPNVNTDQKPRRPSWANFSKRAMPLNYYSEFSRLPKKIPGNEFSILVPKASKPGHNKPGRPDFHFGKNMVN